MTICKQHLISGCWTTLYWVKIYCPYEVVERSTVDLVYTKFETSYNNVYSIFSLIPMFAIVRSSCERNPTYQTKWPRDHLKCQYRTRDEATRGEPISTAPVGQSLDSIELCVLYEDIDQTLPNKLHGQTHDKLCVTCVYNGHVFYTLFYNNMTI